ncbi:MAG: carbohydrate binding family 9 domain-containing protein [Acidobacteria bacterium]|nr:carbohydrate binding family 9 domain-containing protein [Acidobacteriota bacterium]
MAAKVSRTRMLDFRPGRQGVGIVELNRVMRVCAVVVVCLGGGGSAAAQTGPVPTVTAGRLASGAAPPVIDGRVNEAVWEGVAPYSTFTQQDPRMGEPATEKTDVRLLFSLTHVYVSFVCHDQDPSKIIMSQARRDASLAETDSVIMIFDTFNDNQNAFVFGTNPLGIEYDGQVAREGQSGGVAFGGGAAGTQRGAISAFNPNWDGDWVVRAQVTERGWEAELAIPLKTLRYATGDSMTWGFNVMRNIRHKNEQVYLSEIPRGFDIYRISLAAKVPGLVMPPRRDIKLIPYALGSSNRDFTRAGAPTDTKFNGGIDAKWGITPSLTMDATINTDFAQVEADEEQVNLTRFDLFFPEKRPFFLENATTFQFGQPQQIDLFFSRRIGLSGAASSLQPIPIIAGGRVSGKVGGSWNVGALNIQTNDEQDLSGRALALDTNFSVMRVQKEIGRSSYGAIFVNKQTTDPVAGTSFSKWNRAYGLDANYQLSPGQRVSAFVARTDSPGATGSDYSSRVFYDFRNPIWQVSGGYTQVGERFNPEVGFLPRRGYRRPELRVFFQPQPKRIRWIRRVSPHLSYNSFYDLNGNLQTSYAHVHLFEIQPIQGGRFGWFFDHNRDNPLVPFTVYNRDGKRVTIPAGQYSWLQHAFEYFHNPSSAVTGTFRFRTGQYYNGDFNAVEITSDYRFSARFIASLGWTRQDIRLPQGSFVANLIPFKASYAFTNLASLSALVQYNGQTGQYSSNVRLALLNRSGTGLFVVFNDRRDVLSSTSYDTVGRSVVVKYTRLFDF